MLTTTPPERRPGANAAAETIVNLALGFMASKHLFVASEVGLFAQLASGPATLDELAARTELPPRTLRMVADAMVALGVLNCDAGRYENSRPAQIYLSGQSGDDLCTLLAAWDRVSYPAWQQFAAGVRTGQQQPRHHGRVSEEEEERIRATAMETLAAGPARALVSAFDFSVHRRILDLGGGSGAFLLAALGAWPDLSGTLLELPSVAALARQRVALALNAERAAVVTADFFVDPIPGGHDVVILANVVHLFSPERNRTLFRRTRQAVAPGARLLLVDMWTDPTRTRPLAAALLSGEYLVMSGEGDVYSERDVRGWLHPCGWQPLCSSPLTGPWSLLTAQAV